MNKLTTKVSYQHYCLPVMSQAETHVCKVECRIHLYDDGILIGEVVGYSHAHCVTPDTCPDETMRKIALDRAVDILQLSRDVTGVVE